MNGVYIMRRARKQRKPTYYVRWIDPVSRKWRSNGAGTDRNYAMRVAARMEEQLAEGTYRDVKRIGWREFVEDHVGKIKGERNAVEARRTLEEFGKHLAPSGPKDISYAMIEKYVALLWSNGNKPATVNKKLRYLRAALNKAVRRGYAGRNWMDAGLFEKEEQKPPRVATEAEERALLASAEALYGLRMRAFVYVALNTGGRRGELLGLTWGRVRLDGDEPEVHFAKCKGKRDRIIPIEPEVAAVLRRLQAQTIQAGGPFAGMGTNLSRQWGRIRQEAGVPDVTIHDLRRTYITRLIRAGVPLPTVQKLAGHANIQTTLKFYNWVSQDDLRAGVAKLRSIQAAG